MSLFEPINCVQSVTNYCTDGYDPSLYSGTNDCLNNKPCSASSFAQCGDSFNSYIKVKKQSAAKAQNVDLYQVYWDYTPAEEYSMYNEWSNACEYNAAAIHIEALNLSFGLGFEEFLRELGVQTNGLTKTFTGSYLDEFFQTYRTQTLPESEYSEIGAGQSGVEGIFDKKNLLIIGGVALGLWLLNKK
tara:strand:- start:928 stop:1491 length:564 start_codon:yes stop_codon:yes gene_type:complete